MNPILLEHTSCRVLCFSTFRCGLDVWENIVTSTFSIQYWLRDSKLSLGEVNRSFLLSEISFYSDGPAICNHKTGNSPPQMKILSKVIPNLMHFFTLSSFKVYPRKHFCNENQMSVIHNDVGFATMYPRIYCHKLWRYPIRHRFT